MNILKYFCLIWSGTCLAKIRFDLGTALGTFIDARGMEASYINPRYNDTENIGRENITIERYYGIPYAKPPVGELRWKVTEEMEKWEKEIDATNISSVPMCAQVTNPEVQLLMSEGNWIKNLNLRFFPIFERNFKVLKKSLLLQFVIRIKRLSHLKHLSAN